MVNKLAKSLGFSFAELLVVMVVIGILAAAAIPSMNSFMVNSRLKAAGEALYQGVNLARSEAIRRHATVYFSFNPGSSWCFGSNVGSACTCSTSGSCGLQTVQGSDFSGKSLSSSYSGAGNSLNFDGVRGTTSTGTVSVGVGSQLFTVNLNSSGAPRICTTNLSGYTAC